MNCAICFDNMPTEEFVRLTCEHSFCKLCLSKDWTEKIKSGMINETNLKCPFEACNSPINYYILKQNLPKDIFEKYDMQKLSLLEVQNKNMEKPIQCPKCSLIIIIWKDADFFTCPICKMTRCSKEDCFGIWDKHNKLNCLEYQKKYNENESFDLLRKEKGWKKCPVCHSIIEKIRDCNAVTCSSMKCQKKTIFCYLCEKFLEKDKIESHFLKGEYKDCINSQDSSLKNEAKISITIKKNNSKINDEDSKVKKKKFNIFRIIVCLCCCCGIFYGLFYVFKYLFVQVKIRISKKILKFN